MNINSGRIFCIGRNYAEHAAELSNAVPKSPVIFMKPASCLVPPGVPIPFPTHGKDLQHEVELVVRIGDRGRINGFTVGLDLTLRDVQQALKEKGLPWEKAKAFEKSAPIGPIHPIEGLDLNSLELVCRVNGAERQRGNTRDMIFSTEKLIEEISRIWELLPGDLIYTGTPKGVGPLRPGDKVEIECPPVGPYAWEITPSGTSNQA